MRKVILLGLLLSAVIVACESKTPTGPSSVTVQQTTTTSVATTTTIPGGGGGGTTTTIPDGGVTSTIPPTTTTVGPTSVSRRYVGSGGNPVLPNELTLLIQLVTGTSSRLQAMLEHLSLSGTAPAGTNQTGSFPVTGVYRTPAGGGGTVQGTLDGSLESGTFTGTLTAETPGCTAQREFSGLLSETTVRWNGQRTLRDCKDSPLSFGSFTMVRSDNGLPPTTSIPTTSIPPCTYGLNPGGATIGLGGGSGSIQVVTQPGCGWSAQSFVPWVTVLPASGGVGPGAAQYTVAATSAARQATFVIAGLSFILRQEPPPTTTTTAATTTVGPTTTVPATTTVATTTIPTTTTTIPATTTVSTTTTTVLATTTVPTTVPSTTTSVLGTTVGIVTGRSTR